MKTTIFYFIESLRSHIHGRGLYCKRNIDEGEMVIEYSGEVIRGSLTDKREKYYEGKVRHTFIVVSIMILKNSKYNF